MHFAVDKSLRRQEIAKKSCKTFNRTQASWAWSMLHRCFSYIWRWQWRHLFTRIIYFNIWSFHLGFECQVDFRLNYLWMCSRCPSSCQEQHKRQNSIWLQACFRSIRRWQQTWLKLGWESWNSGSARACHHTVTGLILDSSQIVIWSLKIALLEVEADNNSPSPRRKTTAW